MMRGDGRFHRFARLKLVAVSNSVPFDKNCEE